MLEYTALYFLWVAGSDCCWNILHGDFVRFFNCEGPKSLCSGLLFCFVRTIIRGLSALPLLSRSNSTGSVLNSKRNISSNKQAKSSSSSSLYSCCSTLNVYPVQKSTSGKSYGGSYGNGFRVSPVLNVPTPCVSKGSANLFGFGSFLGVGKVKRSKK